MPQRPLQGRRISSEPWYDIGQVSSQPLCQRFQVQSDDGRLSARVRMDTAFQGGSSLLITGAPLVLSAVSAFALYTQQSWCVHALSSNRSRAASLIECAVCRFVNGTTCALQALSTVAACRCSWHCLRRTCSRQQTRTCLWNIHALSKTGQRASA